MRHARLAVILLLAVVLSIAPVLMPPRAPGVGATVATAAQDPSAVEAAQGLDRPTRWLIQQGLRNEGFDAGEPDGLFGPADPWRDSPVAGGPWSAGDRVRTSRSMRRSRTSWRSRANASRSAVVRPVVPFVRSARACFDPVAARRLRQAQIARRGRDRLARIEDQSYRLRRGVIREAPPRPPALRVRHGRHRIPLSEDVHQTRSRPVFPQG